MMRRFLASAVAVGALIAAPGLVAPAHAAGSGTLTLQSGVLYECVQHPYSYSLALPAGTTYWNMDVTVRGPDGLEAGGDYLYAQPSTSGTAGFQLCPSSGPGTYTVSAVGEYHDADYNRGTFTLPPVTFQMRLPMTRTTLKATVKKNKKTKKKTVVLRTLTTDERPNGYFATSYPDVVIQQRRGSSWRTVPNIDVSADSDGEGYARFTWPLKKKATLRAHTEPDDVDDFTSSDSASVRIR